MPQTNQQKLEADKAQSVILNLLYNLSIIEGTLADTSVEGLAEKELSELDKAFSAIEKYQDKIDDAIETLGGLENAGRVILRALIELSGEKEDSDESFPAAAKAMSERLQEIKERIDAKANTMMLVAGFFDRGGFDGPVIN